MQWINKTRDEKDIRNIFSVQESNINTNNIGIVE